MYISIGGFKLDPFGQLAKERAVAKYDQAAATYHARHFAEKATAGFDAFADSLPRSSGEQGLSPDDTDRWASEHSRTPTKRGSGSADA